jgi:hypothetical protein
MIDEWEPGGTVRMPEPYHLAPQLGCSGVLRLRLFLNLPCRNPHDMDGVADHIGGRF